MYTCKSLTLNKRTYYKTPYGLFIWQLYLALWKIFSGLTLVYFHLKQIFMMKKKWTYSKIPSQKAGAELNSGSERYGKVSPLFSQHLFSNKL